MDNKADNKKEKSGISKKITINIAAHVDAGKTTLSEALLYFSTKALFYSKAEDKQPGRVDKRDSFLDNNTIERERGITVYSKPAVAEFGDLGVTIIDTPGHTDFSAETERTMNVTDYGVLVVSGTEPLQDHTLTLWKLFEFYNIPVILFVNKMDISHYEKDEIVSALQKGLSGSIIDFGERKREEFAEDLAVCDETLLEKYSEDETLSQGDIAEAIKRRKVFPCIFGSALKLSGVEELIDVIKNFTLQPRGLPEFSARVYKISHDEKDGRLTFMKVTGGSLRPKMQIQPYNEKVNQIRLYSGERFALLDEARVGDVVAVTGLSSVFAGEGLGGEADSKPPRLESVLTYRLIFPEEVNINDFYRKLRLLQEEDPQLFFSLAGDSINVRVMGRVQLEVLKRVVADRFDVDIDFGEGEIIYKESILSPADGIGHFEPLRHYAEVHLRLEPKDGSGISFESAVSEDVLSANWQNLIRSHVFEKQHKGVLTGADITGIKITLTAGRAHLKHTEGGDFREAVYRAIRNALRKAESVLLEPFYDFRLEIPAVQVGRAMNDLRQMSGSFSQPEIEEGRAVITGEAPVIELNRYASEISAYTKGKGRLSCTFCGYRPCHDQAEVIARKAYDVDADLENTADSVFCKGGAALLVRWDEVDDYKHIDAESERSYTAPVHYAPINDAEYMKALDRKIEENYRERVLRSRENNQRSKARVHGEDAFEGYELKEKKQLENCLLVDGYNIIYAWEELREIAKDDYNAARSRLIDILSNYKAGSRETVVVVFDAYKVKGGSGSVTKYHNITVVFTKEAQTADMYIEEATHKNAGRYRIRVATSDSLEQMIILGRGALRISAADLLAEVRKTETAIGADRKKIESKNYLGDLF